MNTSFDLTSWSACGAGLAFLAAKEPAVELGHIVGDCLRECRENLQAIFEKRRKMKEARHLTEDNSRPVDPKFGIPWYQAAMLEPNETLQEAWSRLLTNAEDPNFKHEIKVAFIDILKTLTPMEVAILNSVYNFFRYKGLWDQPQCLDFTIALNKTALIEKFKADELAYAASLLNLERCQLITTFHPVKNISVGGNPGVNKGDPALTALGVLFINACIAPLETLQSLDAKGVTEQ